jgi:LPXTG-site transpeptidase (sortase) family protein
VSVSILILLLNAVLYWTVRAASTERTAQGPVRSQLLQGNPAVGISKLTNGPGGTPQDGPFILTGQDVTWTYIITNSGDEVLADLTVVDDNGTAANPGDDLQVCTFASLSVGASQTCTLTLPGGAQQGTYTNSATVTGVAGSVTVTASDASSYFGASPAVGIIKFTNGIDANSPPGPTLLVGSSVNWTYFVQNNGNVDLSQVSVSDNQGVAVSCPTTTLAVSENMTCTASGVAQAGQYSNTGLVSAQPPVGPVITASDLSHYFGQGPTNTATATATSTATVTPTITGTPPTPTATGTITPNPVLSVSVSPLQARVNQSLTFTIRVTNPGTAPAFSAVLTDNFPTFIDVINVTFDVGVVTKTNHSVTVNLGDLMPGANATITILTRVNSSLTRSQTVSNVATITYNTNLVRTASVVYSAILASTLPGTGELPLVLAAGRENRSLGSFWVWGSLALGIIFSGWSFARIRNRGLFYLLGGSVILVVFLVAACSASVPTENQVTISPLPSETSTQTLMPFMPAYRFATPEVYPTMPKYSIPPPTLLPVDNLNGEQPDTSPIVRLVIPSLKVDALVHYVPFEDPTWPVDNLREDVAWLGNSSWPGLGGNTVLAGHITVRGLGDGPFRYLEDLQQGEEVFVYTEAAVYTYLAREQVTVEDTDLGVTLPTTHAQLTLVTCTGWDTELSIYRFRRVVFADFIHSEPLIVQGRAP